MSGEMIAVLGSFDKVEEARSAVIALREGGFDVTSVYSPVNSREIAPENKDGDWAIGWLAFGGAIVGGALGLSLTIGTSLQHPMITGGQPIVSMPPFLVVSFELAILFGAIATMGGLLRAVRRGRAPQHYDSRFSADRFGICVVCGAERLNAVKKLLWTAGAEGVRDEKR